MYTNAKAKFRFDGAMEANCLELGGDVADGVDEHATGEKMLYLQHSFLGLIY